MKLSYLEYLDLCRWNRNGKRGEGPFDVDTFTLDIDGEKTGIKPPENYQELLDKINKSISRRMKRGETQVGVNGIAVLINDSVTINGVQELGEHFAKEVGEKLYGSEVSVAHVHPYQLQAVDEEDQASWLWHYDNCAPGMIKLMVYLNDTDANNGGMCILKNAEGHIPMIESGRLSPEKMIRHVYPRTRFPQHKIDQYKAEGYEEYFCSGPSGTFLTFNTNIYHKGTVAKQEPGRRCIIYLFRPYHENLDKHIGKDITYGWECPINCKGYSFDEIKTKKRKK